MTEEAEVTQEVTPAPTGFYDSLTPEMQANPNMQKFKGSDSMAVAEAYNNVSSMIGKDKVVIPNWDNQTEVDSFYSSIGKPGSADGYDFVNGSQLEDIGGDLSAFKQIMHDANLSQRQADKVLEGYVTDVNNTQVNAQAAQTKAFGESDQALRKEWGAAYNEKNAQADFAIKNSMPDENGYNAIKEMMNGPNGTLLKRVFADMGATLSENKIGNSPQPRYSYTPSEAQEKIVKLERSEDLKSDDVKVRQPVIDQLIELHKIANV